MPFSLLGLEHLGDGGAAELTPASAGHVPFDEVTPFGQCCPIGITLIVARNGKEFPARADLHALEDIDPGHCSPPPVILTDNKADNKNAKLKNLKGRNGKLAFYQLNYSRSVIRSKYRRIS
jgi:hypothetical protein